MKSALKRVLEDLIQDSETYDIQIYSGRGHMGQQTIAVRVSASIRQKIIDTYDALDAVQEMVATSGSPVDVNDGQLRVDALGKDEILVY